MPLPLRPGGPPILIGGSGEKRTLRLVAKYGDESNLTCEPSEIPRKLEALARHCADFGRDPETIGKTWLGSLIIAPTHELAVEARNDFLARRGLRWDSLPAAAARDHRPRARARRPGRGRRARAARDPRRRPRRHRGESPRQRAPARGRRPRRGARCARRSASRRGAEALIGWDRGRPPRRARRGRILDGHAPGVPRLRGARQRGRHGGRRHHGRARSERSRPPS